MRTTTAVIVTAIVALSGCSDDGPRSSADGHSGISGRVHLGPQCPVEQAGIPCPDKPAANATVTVSRQLPGEAYAAGPTVAQTTTDADGRYRVAVSPGAYVVTADAGMSCELMDVRVRDGVYAQAPIPCDTGIR
jgi:Carboxypeptidase regulatory-like domain